MTKGILVFVLRSTTDCTNGGVTSKYDKFVLTGEGLSEIFSPSEDAPELRLVKRVIGGKPYLHAEPANQPSGMCGPMAGGNYVTTSDSRFPSQYPISVHDRFETWEQYDSLSR